MDSKELLRKAKEFEERGDDARAYQYRLEAAIEDNDGAALNELAKMYMEGDYVGLDFDKAAHYFELAYEKGFDLSGELFVFVGSGYENGDRYREKAPETAMKWYEMAADEGVDYAYACMGELYFKGEGVEQDYKKAYDLFKKSGEQETLPLYYLGLMYEEGLYVDADRKKAGEYYEKVVKEHRDCKAYGDLHYELAEKRLTAMKLRR